jgi:hypothetical protein
MKVQAHFCRIAEKIKLNTFARGELIIISGLLDDGCASTARTMAITVKPFQVRKKGGGSTVLNRGDPVIAGKPGAAR